MTPALQTPCRFPKFLTACALAALVAGTGACRQKPPATSVRVSGQIEATDVQVGAPVAGRLLELAVSEGDRVEAGAVIGRLDSSDADLALRRARAERDQASAQLSLLRAGARPEDIRQAEAQLATLQAEAAAAQAEHIAAETDADRFESLLASNSGSRKQRDDAVMRRDVTAQRVKAAEDRIRAARENLARLRAGSRREEIDAARARVTAAEAQIDVWQKAISDATVSAPVTGIVSEKIADAGELLQPRAPIVTITDLDHPWANVYVDEPYIPRLRLGQTATIFTDAGGAGMPGTVSYISAKAEFTPRNVQTAEDRSKLVYRVKVALNNRDGVFKAGMPVEAEIPLPDDPVDRNDIVRLDGVSKRYGGVTALRELTLSVSRGEMFGLIGPDGAGKTTTIRLVCGLLQPDGGTIRVLGLDPVGDHRRLTRSVGYLSQRFSLYGDLSVDENIAFFAEIHGVDDYAARRDRLLELTQLKPFRSRLADRLSGGMKQKLALACTLVHEPALIVLDEPTTGVDPLSRREFWKLLSEFLAQGITIVMATPYLDEAERCSRVALLHEGRLLALDQPTALRGTLAGALYEVIGGDHHVLQRALSRIPGVDDVQMFGERAHVRMHAGAAGNVEFLRDRLNAEGLALTSVRPIATSLEDVFIARLGEASS